MCAGNEAHHHRDHAEPERRFPTCTVTGSRCTTPTTSQSTWPDGSSRTMTTTAMLSPGHWWSALMATWSSGATETRRANGGAPVDYVTGADIEFHNNFDELILIDTAGIRIDRVAWDDGRTFPDPTGASMSLGGLAPGQQHRGQLVQGDDPVRGRRSRHSRSVEQLYRARQAAADGESGDHRDHDQSHRRRRQRWRVV